MRRDGSRLRELTGHEPFSGPVEDTPDYSPDGRHIVFCRGCAGGGDGAIHRIRADGSHRRRVLRSAHAANPTYAPDGDRIVLTIRTTIQPYGSCSDLYTMSPNGSNRSRISNNCAGLGAFGSGGFAAEPTWQPLPRSR